MQGKAESVGGLAPVKDGSAALRMLRPTCGGNAAMRFRTRIFSVFGRCSRTRFHQFKRAPFRQIFPFTSFKNIDVRPCACKFLPHIR